MSGTNDNISLLNAQHSDDVTLDMPQMEPTLGAMPAVSSTTTNDGNSTSGNMMNLHVKTLTGQVFEVSVPNSPPPRTDDVKQYVC
jgi:hypothetical protein